MQASARWAILFPLFMSLGACASMDAQSARSTPQGKVVAFDDQAYVQRVEQLARQRGITVVWVNPPAKPADAGAEAEP